MRNRQTAPKHIQQPRSDAESAATNPGSVPTHIGRQVMAGTSIPAHLSVPPAPAVAPPSPSETAPQAPPRTPMASSQRPSQSPQTVPKRGESGEDTTGNFIDAFHRRVRTRIIRRYDPDYGKPEVKEPFVPPYKYVSYALPKEPGTAIELAKVAKRFDVIRNSDGEYAGEQYAHIWSQDPHTSTNEGRTIVETIEPEVVRGNRPTHRYFVAGSILGDLDDGTIIGKYKEIGQIPTVKLGRAWQPLAALQDGATFGQETVTSITILEGECDAALDRRVQASERQEIDPFAKIDRIV